MRFLKPNKIEVDDKKKTSNRGCRDKRNFHFISQLNYSYWFRLFCLLIALNNY